MMGQILYSKLFGGSLCSYHGGKDWIRKKFFARAVENLDLKNFFIFAKRLKKSNPSKNCRGFVWFKNGKETCSVLALRGGNTTDVVRLSLVLWAQRGDSD